MVRLNLELLHSNMINLNDYGAKSKKYKKSRTNVKKQKYQAIKVIGEHR